MAKKSVSDKLVDKVQQVEMQTIEPTKKTLSQIATKLNTKFGKNGNAIYTYRKSSRKWNGYASETLWKWLLVLKAFQKFLLQYLQNI